jgi:hypothetical protein
VKFVSGATLTLPVRRSKGSTEVLDLESILVRLSTGSMVVLGLVSIRSFGRLYSGSEKLEPRCRLRERTFDIAFETLRIAELMMVGCSYCELVACGCSRRYLGMEEKELDDFGMGYITRTDGERAQRSAPKS